MDAASPSASRAYTSPMSEYRDDFADGEAHNPSQRKRPSDRLTPAQKEALARDKLRRAQMKIDAKSAARASRDPDDDGDDDDDDVEGELARAATEADVDTQARIQAFRASLPKELSADLDDDGLLELMTAIEGEHASAREGAEDLLDITNAAEDRIRAIAHAAHVLALPIVCRFAYSEDLPIPWSE